MVIGVMGIGDISTFKISGQHTADKPYVLHSEMGWCMAAVEQSIVGNRDALSAAAMPDPGDPAGVEMSCQCSSGNCAHFNLIDEGVRVP